MEYILYMFVDQNSFARERPFFANKNVTLAKLSQKNVTFTNSKKTFARVSHRTFTAFAIKTPYKDL